MEKINKSVWDKFPSFIREYVFSLGWKELYDIQENAAKVILQSNDNLLLSCGTASGKTEAVFFPMLADICRDFDKRSKNSEIKSIPEGTQILYIAPLKALINDQFERISILCSNADISIHHRHGEVPSAEKERYFKKPSTILQITPESLEAMLMRHPLESSMALSSLRYVVIDELHSVMGSDRGNQIRCLIGRIMMEANVNPRIFALSATIGDTKATCKWLSACNSRNTVCPKGGKGSEGFRASVLFEAFENIGQCEQFIYRAVRRKNSLVFSNSRDETERITYALRNIAKTNGDRDDIYIHHGNISTALRRDAEKALKDSTRHSVVCATSTLELGIDIGRLERVVSFGSPNTVSGFLQRLGRSGRRENPPEMLSVFCVDGWENNDADNDGNDNVDAVVDTTNENIHPSLLPWEFLQGIAIVELYRREKFIEPPEEKKYPYSLLCHQTISILASHPEGLLPAELARKVLRLAPFSHIPPEDLRELLMNLKNNGYIELVDGRRLIVGLSGERLISSYRFLAVFKDEESYTVKDEGAGGKEIGILPEAVMPGGRFSLAGRSWTCERLDSETRTIYARRVSGKMTSCWKGSLAGIDGNIAKYVAKILEEDEIYPYIGKNAAKILTDARLKARGMGIPGNKLICTGHENFIFLPWLGSTAMATMRRYINYTAGSMLLSGISHDEPYVLSFKMREADADLFLEYLSRGIYEYGDGDVGEDSVTDSEENPAPQLLNCEKLMSEHEHFLSEKFDSLVPQSLLKKAFAADRLNMEQVAGCFKNS